MHIGMHPAPPATPRFYGSVLVLMQCCFLAYPKLGLYVCCGTLAFLVIPSVAMAQKLWPLRQSFSESKDMLEENDRMSLIDQALRPTSLHTDRCD